MVAARETEIPFLQNIPNQTVGPSQKDVTIRAQAFQLLSKMIKVCSCRQDSKTVHRQLDLEKDEEMQALLYWVETGNGGI